MPPALYGIFLAVHIAAVVVAFGVTFSYPILVRVVLSTNVGALPALHRAQYRIGSRVIGPGLGVIVLTGLALAGSSGAFDEFWVWWAIGAAIVLGGLGGAVQGRAAEQMAEVAARDVGERATGEAGVGAAEPAAANVGRSAGSAAAGSGAAGPRPAGGTATAPASAGPPRGEQAPRPA